MNRDSRTWLQRLLASAALAIVATVLIAGPGLAHSQEVASDPADQSKVAIVPAAVTLTFNENVIGMGTRVEVSGPDGDVNDGPATVTDNVVRQAVSANAPAGKYTVQWRVTSGDGHPVSGTFTFSAAKASGSAPASPSSAPSTPPSSAPSSSAPATPASPATTATSGADPADDAGDGLSGLTVIGIGAIVLAVLIALTAAASAVIRSRRPTS